MESKNRPVATNFQFLKISCPSGTSLLQCVCISEVILLGRACPKPCRVTIKFIIVPWTEYNSSFDDALLLFFAKIQLSSVTCREMQLFHVVSPITWLGLKKHRAYDTIEQIMLSTEKGSVFPWKKSISSFLKICSIFLVLLGFLLLFWFLSPISKLESGVSHS